MFARDEHASLLRKLVNYRRKKFYKGKLLLFFSFFVAAAINSTNEANKAGGKHRKAVYILRCLCEVPTLDHLFDESVARKKSFMTLVTGPQHTVNPLDPEESPRDGDKGGSHVAGEY